MTNITHRAGPQSRSAGQQILIVEDDGLIVARLRDVLANSGYVPLVAASGEEAIRRTAEARPDLVLMDIRLAGELDGVAAAGQIRARFDIPVVYLTAHADEALLQRAKTTEPYSFLLKPVEERELLATVEMALYKHQMERKLKESEERYRQFVENSPNPIFSVDREGIIQTWNRACEKVFDYEIDEIVGQACQKLLWDPASQPTMAANLAQVFQGQVLSGVDISYKRQDGTRRSMSSRLYPLFGHGEKVQGCVFANTDITERVRAEAAEELHREAQERLLTELEVKNRELESFAYTISHDLKAPLISLGGFSSVLQKEFYDQLGEEGKHYLRRIQANVARMDALITHLLELSRIGRVVGPMEEIDVAALLRKIQEELAVELEETGEFVVQEPLPAIRVDRGRIRQVFANLTDNAVKFRSQERPLRIEVGCREERGFYCFHVADNGIGIAPQYHEQIFAPFQQLDAEIEGVGIGLALVKKIMEYHAGRVWVESQPGRGSTFYFTIPVIGK